MHRKDPVFILGQSAGLLIYARNLYFINKQNKLKISFLELKKGLSDILIKFKKLFS